MCREGVEAGEVRTLVSGGWIVSVELEEGHPSGRRLEHMLLTEKGQMPCTLIVRSVRWS